MKSKHQTLFLGMCLGLSLLAANVPAYARTTTAFSSFHIRTPLDANHNPNACVVESYGAVVNRCPYTVGVMFDIPVDSTYPHNTVWAQNYVHGTGTIGTYCALYTFDGNGNGSLGTQATFNASGPQTLQFTPAVSVLAPV